MPPRTKWLNYTDDRTLLRKNTERITSWFFDLKDRLRLATRSAENGDTEVLRVDHDGFAKVYNCNVFETCGSIQFHKDGERTYFITNKGNSSDLIRLELFNPATGKEELVESDPLNRADNSNALFSEVTDDLIATIYEDERLRIYWKDKAFEADSNSCKSVCRVRGSVSNLGRRTNDCGW